MDCEKYEPLLLDELYEELDEVTSAAVKRHVAGCSRCAGILNGMRATRRMAGASALPLVAVPAGLEDRILASVKEAQKVVPIQSRFQRALSVAGSWAMRPQTAMAAVFLLMIGSSAFVIRSRRADAPQAVSVTEQGAPAATSSPAEEQDSLDNKAAAAAHGANTPTTLPPAAAPAASVATLDKTEKTDKNAPGLVDGFTGGKGHAAKDDEGLAVASALRDSRDSKEESKPGDRAERAEGQKAERRAGGADPSNAGAIGGAPNADFAPRGQSVPPPSMAKVAQDPQDGFSAGMAAYRARNFAEATKQFDAAARSGDQNAALWAAKSVKEGNGGCTSAIPRFDAVAQRSPGTWLAGEAQLEAARCQIALGNVDNARDRLARLQSTPSHAPQAQQELNELNRVAEKKRLSGAGAGGGGGASRPAAPAPVRAPAKPAATATPADRANGF